MPWVLWRSRFLATTYRAAILTELIDTTVYVDVWAFGIADSSGVNHFPSSAPAARASSNAPTQPSQ
jgi:hypothetical protein